MSEAEFSPPDRARDSWGEAARWRDTSPQSPRARAAQPGLPDQAKGEDIPDPASVVPAAGRSPAQPASRDTSSRGSLGWGSLGRGSLGRGSSGRGSWIGTVSSLAVHAALLAALIVYDPWLGSPPSQEEGEISVEVVEAPPEQPAVSEERIASQDQPAPEAAAEAAPTAPEPTAAAPVAEAPPDAVAPAAPPAVAETEPPAAPAVPDVVAAPETSPAPSPPAQAEAPAVPPQPTAAPTQEPPPAPLPAAETPELPAVPPPTQPTPAPPAAPARPPIKQAAPIVPPPPSLEQLQREREAAARERAQKRAEQARRDEAEAAARERAQKRAEQAKRDQEAKAAAAQSDAKERAARADEAKRQGQAARTVLANVQPQANPAAAASYRGLVMSHLAAFKRYPPAARARGAQGSPAVSFSLDGSGRVTGVSLLRGSGDPDIDAEAVAMVRRASPFPTPPPGAPHGFSAGVNFRLQ